MKIFLFDRLSDLLLNDMNQMHDGVKSVDCFCCCCCCSYYIFLIIPLSVVCAIAVIIVR